MDFLKKKMKEAHANLSSRGINSQDTVLQDGSMALSNANNNVENADHKKSPGKRKKNTRYPNDIPPGGESVAIPNDNDVLSGRGGRINSHPGNVQFRELVKQHQAEYLAKTTRKLDKAKIADKIIQQIRSMDPPGRFLREDAASGQWIEIGDARARKKTGQAMREGAPNIREELEAAEDDDSDDHNIEEKPLETKSMVSSSSNTLATGAAEQASMQVQNNAALLNEAQRNEPNFAQSTVMDPSIPHASQPYCEFYSDSHAPLNGTHSHLELPMNDHQPIANRQQHYYPSHQNNNYPQQLNERNPFGVNMNTYASYSTSHQPVAVNFDPNYQKLNNNMEDQQQCSLPESMNLEPNPVFTNQWTPNTQNESMANQNYFSGHDRNQYESSHANMQTQSQKDVAFNQEFTPIPERMLSDALNSDFASMSTLKDSICSDTGTRPTSPVSLTRTDGNGSNGQWPNQPNKANSSDPLDNSDSMIQSYLPNQLRSSSRLNSIRMNSIRSIDSRKGAFQLRRSLSLTDIDIDFANTSFVFQSSGNNDSFMKILDVSDSSLDQGHGQKRGQSKKGDGLQRNSSSSGSNSCMRSGSSKSKASSPNHIVSWDRQLDGRPTLERRGNQFQRSSNISTGSHRSSGSSFLGSVRASMEFSGSSRSILSDLSNDMMALDLAENSPFVRHL